MNRHREGEGGAALAAAVIILLLILVVVGAGAFWFVTAQRTAMQRAMLAEREARMMAEQARAEAMRAAESEKAAMAGRATEQEASGEPPSENTAESDSPLSSLNWMVGSWRRKEDTSAAEEHWLAARGGMMLGLNREVRDGGKTSFEYLRIEQTDDAIVYYASPGGRSATPFAMVESGDRRVVFENTDHDFPQRIIYWREEDILRARIEGEMAGQQRAAEWQWKSATP